MIKFTIGGRQVVPRNMEDAFMAVVLDGGLLKAGLEN